MDIPIRLFGQRGREVGKAIQRGLRRGPVKLAAILGVLAFLFVASANATAPQRPGTSLAPVGVPVAAAPQCPITTLVPSGDPVATLVVDVHVNACFVSCSPGGQFPCCPAAASVDLPAGQYLVTMTGQECSTEGGPCNSDGTPGGPSCLPTSANICSGETGVCLICAAGHPDAGTVLINHPGGLFRAWRNDCNSSDNFGKYTLKFYPVPPPDTTPPVVDVNFPSPDGQNDWFVTSSVAGNITADDTTTGGSNITDITCTGATVGPITGLGTPNASASLTVSDEGVHNVSCTATDSASNSGAAAGSNNTATVMIDTMTPTFSCAGAPTTWSASDVSRACTADDDGSGLATPANFSLTTNVPNDTETANALTGTAEVCDNAGNCLTAGPLDGNMVDKKAPVQTTCDTPDGVWHANNMTLNCTYSDGGSGPASQTVALTTNVPAGTEDANASASANGAQACDTVSNCAASPADVTGSMIDRKAPSVSCGSADTNWHADNQSVTCTATDGGSGPASQTLTLSTSVTPGDETDNAFTNSASACDAVNNCATAGPVGPFKIDQKGPTVTCTATPTYLLTQAGATVSATVTDSGSGPATSPVSVPVSTNAVGSYTAPVTGFDNVDNSTTTNCPYNVIYEFSGFFSPVDNLPTLNGVKAGSAIPVKFSLNGDQGLSIFEPDYPKSQTIACDTTAPVDGVEETVTSGSSGLSYDAGADQYIYVWKTNKAWAGTCRQLVVKLNDGTSHQANFNFTK